MVFSSVWLIAYRLADHRTSADPLWMADRQEVLSGRSRIEPQEQEDSSTRVGRARVRRRFVFLSNDMVV